LASTWGYKRKGLGLQKKKLIGYAVHISTAIQHFHSAYGSHNSPLYLEPTCASQYSFKHTLPTTKPFISNHILEN